MSLDRDHGDIVFHCDGQSCREFLETRTSNFEAARNLLRRAQGKRRHARIGEQLQLYTGMRTKHCRLIGRAVCNRFYGVFLKFSVYQQFFLFDVVETEPGRYRRAGKLRPLGDPNAFAKSDGFYDLEDMSRFWRDVHGVTSWEGLLIGWADFEAAA